MLGLGGRLDVGDDERHPRVVQFGQAGTIVPDYHRAPPRIRLVQH
jgi:hypothetical protein